jgi:hypothetical protein
MSAAKNKQFLNGDENDVHNVREQKTHLCGFKKLNLISLK